MGIAEAIKRNLKNRMKGGEPIAIQKNMMRRIIVSSNCQTGGIAAALQVIFPNDEVIPLPLPVLSDTESESKLVEKLKKADVWVSIGGHDLPKKYHMEDQIKVLRIPIIRFSGFHPDLVYARRLSTNELIDPHYNSAIAVWAYKNNLSIDSAERLFSRKIFSALGYLNHWGRGIEQLKERFKDSDLDFSEFILPMRREGLFMYSMNHPKAIALVRLAKQIARKLGAGPEVLDRYIDISDGLNDVIWPLYPEIGESLSLHSGYEWKMGKGEWICSLREYLENTYSHYASKRISPDDIFAVQTDEQLYNQVLGRYVGCKS